MGDAASWTVGLFRANAELSRRYLMFSFYFFPLYEQIESDGGIDIMADDKEEEGSNEVGEDISGGVHR